MNLLREGARFCSGRCRVASHRQSKRIPEVMRSRKSWVRADGKRPITVHGEPASSTNYGTWSTFDEVKSSSAGDGFGFMLGDGVGCYDFDDALVNGSLTAKAKKLLDSVSEPIMFAEVSMSGAGLHVFVDAPEGPGVNRAGYERYTRSRFIRMTGREFKF